MKKIIFLLAALPAIAFAATDSGARRFDKANEDFLFAKREHINPTSNEFKDMAKSQGNAVRVKRGFPVLTSDTNAAPEQPSPARPATSAGEIDPAPSYRTMGEAAKAGVDPMKLIKPTESKAQSPEPDSNNELYYYIGGFILFAILAGLGFILSVRTPAPREDQ